MTTARVPEESLIAMAGIPVTAQSLEATLREILVLTCAALPGGDEAGITLLAADGPGTACATSDVALRVDRSQYDTQDGGPCLDACRQRRVVRIDSTTSDRRWPRFSRTASAEGLGSTLSIPLLVGGGGLGALNVYCRREHGFTAADERLAATLGSCASVAAANARGFWRVTVLAEQLTQSLSTRGAVDQATGILIARNRCPAEHARQLLAVAAEHNRLTVTEVARDLVDRTSARQRPAPLFRFGCRAADAGFVSRISPSERRWQALAVAVR